MARIIIIDDEAILAFSIEDFLTEAGFDVVGVAGRLEVALEMIQNTDFDIALVDANLAGVSAGPAVVSLRTRGKPFVVLSGYLAHQLDAVFAGAVCVQKPCRPDQLIRTLRGLPPARDPITIA